MRLLCEDCNNNIATIKELIERIETSESVREWRLFNFSAIPIDTGDLSGDGHNWESPNQKLYEFCQRLLDEHIVILSYKEFISLLDNTKSVYEADVTFDIAGQSNRLIIMDGEFIEVTGLIETILEGF